MIENVKLEESKKKSDGLQAIGGFFVLLTIISSIVAIWFEGVFIKIFLTILVILIFIILLLNAQNKVDSKKIIRRFKK